MIISTKIPTHPWKKPGQTATFEKFVGTPGQAVKNRDVPGKTGTSGHPKQDPFHGGNEHERHIRKHIHCT